MGDEPKYLSIYPNNNYTTTNLIAGFLLIFLIGLNLSVLIGGILAISFSEFLSIKFANRSQNILDLLTNIPFVIYGYLLLLFFNNIADLSIRFNNITACGLILGGMMLPMISHKFIAILQSIPYNQREGAYSLGATRFKAAFMVLIPSQTKLFLSSIISITARTFCEILILLLIGGFIIEK
ncbi:MAG: ABC transporter permease subunit [Saprospiraceae bacterium]|nr:ABC transporter permease subunit [Saprospiraceae bacterium]